MSAFGKWRLKSPFESFGNYKIAHTESFFFVGDSTKPENHYYSINATLNESYEPVEQIDGFLEFRGYKQNKEICTFDNPNTSNLVISVYANPTIYDDLAPLINDWLRDNADKLTDDAYTKLKLVKPTSTLKASVETAILSWDKIEWAGSYQINYTNVNNEEDTGSWTTTATSTDILSHMDTPGTYTFQVKAIIRSDLSPYDFENSNLSEAIEYVVQPRLATPNVRLVDGVISWEAIENADYYEIYSGNDLRCTTAELSCDLKKYLFEVDKGYRVMVRACPSNADYRPSNLSYAVIFVIEIEFEESMIIGEWRFNDNIIMPEKTISIFCEGEENPYQWFYASTYENRYRGMDLVSDGELRYREKLNGVGLSGVKAYINNNWTSDKNKTIGIYRVPTTLSNKFTLASYYNWLLNNGNKISDKAITPTKLATPTLTMTSNVLIWDAIPNARTYSVRAYELDEQGNVITYRGWETSETSCDVEKELQNGRYLFKVKAMGDWDNNYSDSDWSNGKGYIINLPTSINKLPAPVIALSGRFVIWNPVENADYYIVYRDGTEAERLDKVQTVYELFIEGVVHKRVSIQLRAGVNEDSEYTTSAYSNTLVYDPAANDPVVLPDTDAEAVNVTLYDANKGVKLATQGVYCDKDIKVNIDAVSLVNLRPNNIRNGITILNVTGTMIEGEVE